MVVKSYTKVHREVTEGHREYGKGNDLHYPGFKAGVIDDSQALDFSPKLLLFGVESMFNV